MTAQEIVNKFKELCKEDEDLEFRFFGDGGYDDILQPIFGSYDILDITFDDEGEQFSREFITVEFFDHNIIVQQIISYEFEDVTSIEYCTAKPKEIVQTIYVIDKKLS